MELIPVEIRHHFVLRKRFIAYKLQAPDFTEVKFKSQDVKSNEPRKRSNFDQLQLELEKLKNSTDQPSVSIKSRMQELIYGLWTIVYGLYDVILQIKRVRPDDFQVRSILDKARTTRDSDSKYSGFRTINSSENINQKRQTIRIRQARDSSVYGLYQRFWT